MTVRFHYFRPFAVNHSFVFWYVGDFYTWGRKKYINWLHSFCHKMSSKNINLLRCLHLPMLPTFLSSSWFIVNYVNIILLHFKIFFFKFQVNLYVFFPFWKCVTLIFSGIQVERCKHNCRLCSSISVPWHGGYSPNGSCFLCCFFWLMTE